MQRHLVLNGPNLNLLGTRDPGVYGTTTLADLEVACARWGAPLDVEIETFQSNHEGALIDRLHDARGAFDGIVFNPGAFTHTSYALHDAIEAIEVPVVEVHISNVEEREAWRRVSVVRPACVHTIYGRGVEGYMWGIRHLVHRSAWPVETVRWGGHDDALADVRLPSEPGVHPAVVLVHGGMWRHMWTRDVMDGIAVDLARRGYLSANVEYRRVGKGGGWAQTVQDVAHAIASVAARDDVGPIAVVGHSAGGHLAVLARTFGDTGYLPISLAGILDVEGAIAGGLGHGAPELFLGGADPADASPLRAAAGGEVVLVHGADDDVVSVDQSRAYAAVNPAARLTVLEGVGHQEFLDPLHPAWQTVADMIESSLRPRH